MVFTDKVLEEKRYMIESIMRYRYQSFFKIINKYFDSATEHEESATHHSPCVQCFEYNMFMRYYQKKLELEFVNGHYFENYINTVDRSKPLDKTILKLAFVDWNITSNVENTKRKQEQNENRRKRLKEEMDSRQQQQEILLNQ